MRIKSGDFNISMYDSVIEEVDSYIYIFGRNYYQWWEDNEEVSSKIGQATKAVGALQNVWKKRVCSLQHINNFKSHDAASCIP